MFITATWTSRAGNLDGYYSGKRMSFSCIVRLDTLADCSSCHRAFYKFPQAKRPSSIFEPFTDGWIYLRESVPPSDNLSGCFIPSFPFQELSTHSPDLASHSWVHSWALLQESSLSRDMQIYVSWSVSWRIQTIKHEDSKNGSRCVNVFTHDMHTVIHNTKITITRGVWTSRSSDITLTHIHVSDQNCCWRRSLSFITHGTVYCWL